MNLYLAVFFLISYFMSDYNNLGRINVCFGFASLELFWVKGSLFKVDSMFIVFLVLWKKFPFFVGNTMYFYRDWWFVWKEFYLFVIFLELLVINFCLTFSFYWQYTFLKLVVSNLCLTYIIFTYVFSFTENNCRVAWLT